ncbi:alanine acetyltransferase [Primorskyibacter flagellatus]|uniref:Alanine acetyltransferase n=1 Tax=Primorskyibacter flagellatus TaxID=1387277 RepID=A0A917ABJ1_9RHOB|nr:GNAT family N-acetyltransferase [Primorskyibacter flagellatus]GGE41385.1 alanine acetyltransferase [Primorskyibacter flagellatus]
MTPAQLATLHAACFTTPRPWSESEFATLLASPYTFVTGSPDAFAMGRVVAGEAELLTIATAPARRRSGLARTCLARFDAMARDRDAEIAFLEVSAENEAAIALYAATGWTERARRTGYYTAPDGRRIDARILGKSLA